jgi:hypothetical protein
LTTICLFSAGAARAFGLKTLLPLNVASNQPLMYCPDKSLDQAQILLDNKLYRCSENILQVRCNKKNKNSEQQSMETTTEILTDKPEIEDSHSEDDIQADSPATDQSDVDAETETQADGATVPQDDDQANTEEYVQLDPQVDTHVDLDLCLDHDIQCDTSIADIETNLFCKSGVFLSSERIFCDSVSSTDLNSEKILNCRFGYLPPTHTSFIPTIEDPNLDSYSLKPETSYIYNVVSFLVDIFKSKQTPAASQIEFTIENTTEWLPSALPIDFNYERR